MIEGYHDRECEGGECHCEFRKKEAHRVSGLEAEVVRLRAGLQSIADMSDEDNEWDGVDHFREARALARTILNSEKLPHCWGMPETCVRVACVLSKKCTAANSGTG